MNKNIAMLGMIVILPIILIVSLFIKKNVTSVQTLSTENSSVTSDTNVTYPENSSLLTGNIR
ncbi:MAG: hypothetical protein WC657_01395 [Candidatus Paceibacterota bacterium]|jgi:hypothetical protein